MLSIENVQKVQGHIIPGISSLRVVLIISVLHINLHLTEYGISEKCLLYIVYTTTQCLNFLYLLLD